MAFFFMKNYRDVAKPRTLVPRFIAAFIFMVDVSMFLSAILLVEPFINFFVKPFLALEWEEGPTLQLNGIYYFLVGACVLGRFLYKGHYTRRFPWYSQVERILKTAAFFAMLDAFVQFQYDVHPSALAPIYQLGFWVICASLLLIGRYVALTVVSYMGDWDLPVVLVGNAPSVLDCLYAFKADGHTGYTVKAILLQNAKDTPLDTVIVPKAYRDVPVIEDSAASIAYLKDNPDYFYILDIGELGQERNQDLMAAVEKHAANWAVIPNVRFVDAYGMEPHYFFGNDVMILHRRDRLKMPVERFCKRAIDVFATFWALPPLLIMTIIVYISKKMAKSDTPLFYGGERVGAGGKPFKCWKFCTMRADSDKMLQDYLASSEEAREEWAKFNKLKNDPRIDSHVSAFLRKSSLDELPQLWNVFVGDMSLVGPRPLLPNEVQLYGDFDNYRSVRPGITGLWQVSGRNETTFQQRVYWDGWYVRNWSLWHDIVIMIKTLRVFMIGEGAY